MGLLDDAIREHLELRRRHGADPSDVVSKEQEVFGTTAGDKATQTEVESLLAEAPSAVVARDHRPTATRTAMHGAGDDPLCQPTMELDMQTVLNEESTRARLGYATPDGSTAARATAVRTLSQG